MAGTSQWNEYLIVGGKLVGVRFERSDETISTRYFVRDHLGSVAVLTDENGLVVERLSYDAWGKRRFPNGTDDPAGSITSQTSRGFTGQEELADVGLVHLNGRVYDPLIGRMMTADPMVPDPTNGQAWNRYSYVINNPLSFTDPNGYCFLGLCGVFNAIGNFFSSVFNAIGSLFRSIPFLGNILELAAIAILCGPGAVVCAGIVATLGQTFIAGVTSGKLGVALRAGLIAAAQAVAFFAVGSITTGPDSAFGAFSQPANVIGHAAIGCAVSVASGGQCQSGALAAGAGAAASPLVSQAFAGNLIGGSLAEGVVGGLASVAGGGKFMNGAVTAAFGYIFNNLGHSPTSADGDTGGTQVAMQDPASQVAATIQVGFTASGSLGFIPISLNLSLGVAIDDQGNIGFYYTGGSGPSVGVAASFGVSVAGSNADQINYLAGPFVNVSVGGGMGANAGLDGFTGLDPNRQAIVGGGFTWGAGIGGTSSVTVTNTLIVPLFRIPVPAH